jgi:cytochrome oxidase Cu insertion factor (SCO1/SenC/PrrC family)
MKTNPLIIGLVVLTFIVPGTGTSYGKGENEMIAVGEPFIDFELEAHDGTTVSSSDLAGRPYLLFFYPKASTPG